MGYIVLFTIRWGKKKINPPFQARRTHAREVGFLLEEDGGVVEFKV
jgi:hypothetical protein